MSILNRSLAAIILFSASALSTPRLASASAASESQRAAIADSVVSTRLQWEIHTTRDSANQVVEIGQTFPRGVMAYRVRIEVIAAGADDASLDVPQWDVALRLGRDGNLDLYRFTNTSREWSVQKPFGIKLDAGDSVTLTVRLEGTETRPIAVRISIDHDPIDQPSSRLAITPVRVEAGTAAQGQGAIWEWTSKVDGTLMGASDVRRPASADISLVDVTTGATLWSDSARGRAGCDASTSNHSFSGALTAGHVYRLTVSKRDGGVQPGQMAATVMVIATRGTNRVATR